MEPEKDEYELGGGYQELNNQQLGLLKGLIRYETLMKTSTQTVADPPKDSPQNKKQSSTVYDISQTINRLKSSTAVVGGEEEEGESGSSDFNFGDFARTFRIV